MCMEEWEADGSRGFISYAKTVSQRYKGRKPDRNTGFLRWEHTEAFLREKSMWRCRTFWESHRLSKKQEANGFYQGQIHTAEPLFCRGLLFCTYQSRMRPKYYGNQKSAGNRKIFLPIPSKRPNLRHEMSGTGCTGNTLDTGMEKLIEITEERLSFSEILRKGEKFFY